MLTTSPRSTSRPGTSSTRTRASTAETLLPTFPGTAAPNEAVAADKSGRIYLLNTDNLGGFNAGGPDHVLQEFTANPNGLIYSSPVYFNGMVYIQGVGDVIKAYALELDPATNTMLLNETPVSEGTTIAGFPGEVQSVSADGTSNGIVWSADVSPAPGDPPSLQRQQPVDAAVHQHPGRAAHTAGGSIKFSVPTIANGHVYLGALNEVDAYGLLPPPGSSTSPSLSGNAGVSARLAAATVLAPERLLLGRRHTIRSGRDEKVASGVNEGLSPARCHNRRSGHDEKLAGPRGSRRGSDAGSPGCARLWGRAAAAKHRSELRGKHDRVGASDVRWPNGFRGCNDASGGRPAGSQTLDSASIGRTQ